MSTIQNRSELLFLYDVKRCNPNGDPLDSNRHDLMKKQAGALSQTSV